MCFPVSIFLDIAWIADKALIFRLASPIRTCPWFARQNLKAVKSFHAFRESLILFVRLKQLSFSPNLPQTKKQPDPKARLLFGPSDRIRTCGLMVPNHPRYQLRYTRIDIFQWRSHRTTLLLYGEKSPLSSRKPLNLCNAGIENEIFLKIEAKPFRYAIINVL